MWSIEKELSLRGWGSIQEDALDKVETVIESSILSMTGPTLGGWIQWLDLISMTVPNYHIISSNDRLHLSTDILSSQ